jgi:hypothetical protein
LTSIGTLLSAEIDEAVIVIKEPTMGMGFPADPHVVAEIVSSDPFPE